MLFNPKCQSTLKHSLAHQVTNIAIMYKKIPNSGIFYAFINCLFPTTNVMFRMQIY